jgi:curved DNA-binding protein CbpA
MTSALYAENPFRVLGLPVTASERDIRRRAQERLLQAELRALDRLEVERVRTAEKALDDPRERLRHEILAVHLTPLPTDLDFSDELAVAMAEASLLPRAEAGDDEGIHDLAVIRHAAAIACGPENADRWTDALESWSEVMECEAFWKRMDLRAEALADPRATNGAVDSLRRALPSLLLRPSAEVASDWFDEGQLDLAGDHLRVILDSQLSAAAINEARALATERARTRVKDTMKAIRDRIDQDLAAGWLALPTLDTAWRSARDELIPSAERLIAVDPTGPEIQVCADEVAEFLRGLAVRLHNEADATSAAMQPLKSAQRFAISEALS